MATTKDVDIINIDDVNNYFNKKFKKANMADKFKLLCWLDSCTKGTIISFEEYLRAQNMNKFLDKLQIGLVDYSDIGDAEDIEQALLESYTS